jgi:hypothetical protein
MKSLLSGEQYLLNTTPPQIQSRLLFSLTAASNFSLVVEPVLVTFVQKPGHSRAARSSSASSSEVALGTEGGIGGFGDS